jgi:nitronate monooxygenase
MITTRFTELVGCSVPIQQAPMGGVVTPELIAVVTEAGAMAMFAATSMPAPVLAGMVEEMAKHATGPLGVNFLVPFMDDAAVEEAASRARLVDFYHAPPAAGLVTRVHACGALAGWQVGSVAEAREAADAGCDLIVVRGVEGGGRMWGSEALFPLLARVLDAVEVPVVAAGGIGDERGVAAALAAGAAGVRIGTRLLATQEMAVHPVWRQALIDADAADTVLTDEFSVEFPARPAFARVLTRSLEAARAATGDTVGEITMGGMTMPVTRLGVAPPLAGATGEVEAMAMYAGESVAFVHSVEPAGDVIRSLAEGAERLLRAWC